MDWQTGATVVPLLKRRDCVGCASTMGGPHSGSPGYNATVGWQIQEEQYGFHPGAGTLDQLHTLYGVQKGSRALDHEFNRGPEGILWLLLWDVASGAHCSGPPGPCMIGLGVTKYDLCPVHAGLRQGCTPFPALFIIIVERNVFEIQPGAERCPDWEPHHWVSVFFFADDVIMLPSLSQDLRWEARCFPTGPTHSVGEQRSSMWNFSSSTEVKNYAVQFKLVIKYGWLKSNCCSELY